MQYTTTRNNAETFSVLHALNDTRASDGGFYVPGENMAFTPEEIQSFALKNPNQAVAEILNRLFDCQLNRWDVDFSVGRYPVRLTAMSHRITVAESWHNLDWDFHRMVTGAASLVRGSRDESLPVGSWAEIAVRIGVLFGIFGELMREGLAGKGQTVDVVVPSGDFSAVISAWYARSWGLPVGNIVCCCNENNNLWDLVCQGQLRTGISVRNTSTPHCDRVVPEELERLVYACGDLDAVEEFVRCCQEGRTWFPDETTLEKLRSGLHVTVVGQRRMESTIPNAYKTHGYIFGPYSALTYAGLLDYRARTGENRDALILSERGALCDDGFVARAMGITVSKLHQML